MRLIFILVCCFLILGYLMDIKHIQIESLHIQKEILEQLQDTTKYDTIPCYETPD